MRYGFDYITSGSYAGDWSELYFPVDTTVTLTTTKGDSVTTTFTEGTSIVGTYVGINISSGGIIAYRRSDTDKFSLQDPAITALLSQAATDGYTAASGATLTALDTYVKGLKADGIWDKLDLLYVFATNGDSDFATYNLKDPANFQATKVNAPTFTSLEGFTGDGTSSHLSTPFNFSSNAINTSTDNVFTSIYVRAVGTDSKYIFGALDSSTNGYHTGSDIFTRCNSVDFSTSPIASSGFLGLRRIDSANYDILNNAVVSNIAAASTALPNEVLKILIRGGSTASPSNAQVSIFTHGAYLDNTEYGNYRTRTEAYMDALGKGVL